VLVFCIFLLFPLALVLLILAVSRCSPHCSALVINPENPDIDFSLYDAGIICIPSRKKSSYSCRHSCSVHRARG
jgi:hypothetical protein